MLLLTILLKAKLIALFFACAMVAVGWFVYKKQKSPKRPEPTHGPKVWFSGGGRGGDMGYESRESSFKMYWEMGGGDVLAIIYVPVVEHWEAETKIPLEKRLEVLHFIGKKTVERQTTGGKGSYEIHENYIIIKP